MNTIANRGLSRRAFLRMTSLAAAGAALAACIPQGNSAPAASSDGAAPAAENATVQYWTGWGGDYAGKSWDDIRALPAFQELMGSNQIEIKVLSGEEALLTAVAGGTPPEGSSNINYLDYMARDVLVPIADWVANSELIREDAYLPGTWTDSQYKGTMYGVPTNEGFTRYALNYNSRLVEEAGLDPDAPPQTWEDCLAWHEKLTKFDSAGNAIQIGLDPYDAMGGNIKVPDGFFSPLSFGWDWFNEDTGAFDLANDKMAQSFELLGEFYKVVGPDNMTAFRQVEGQGDWGGSFKSEVQAMLIDGYWHPGETTIQTPEVGKVSRSVWAPVSEERRGVKVQGSGGHYIILFKGAPQSELMYKIAEFCNRTEVCDIIFNRLGYLPAIKAYLETADSGRYPGLQFFFDSAQEADEFTSPARCPITNYVYQQYVDLREKVYREQMTGADAAAEFQKRCEDEYKAGGF